MRVCLAILVLAQLILSGLAASHLHTAAGGQLGSSRPHVHLCLHSHHDDCHVHTAQSQHSSIPEGTPNHDDHDHDALYLDTDYIAVTPERVSVPVLSQADWLCIEFKSVNLEADFESADLRSARLPGQQSLLLDRLLSHQLRV